ncbi:hypothetical protein T03_13614 [Trichinella britovi]|uniref:Uncharacterized protein n=1 Tax=Trichinella britovi TaxID=45882 RepID=A0A0V1CTL6_TRIBR|nr:hypothetical protein T03_13614 [Trichinella britovi]
MLNTSMLDQSQDTTVTRSVMDALLIFMPLAMIGQTRLALCLGVHRNGLLFSVITVVAIRNGGVGDVEIDFIEQRKKE